MPSSPNADRPSPVPARAIGWALAGTVVLAVTGPLEGFRFAWGGIATMAGLIGLLGAVAVIYGRSGRAPRLAAAAGAIAMILWLGVVGGFLAYVALAAGAPFVDASLDAATRTFGFDHAAFTAAVSQIPLLVTILHASYVTTVPVLIATAVGLALAGADRRLRTFLGDYATLLMVTVALSAAFPARGPFLLTPLAVDVRARLPAGAGDFYRGIFEAVRDGRMHLFDPSALEGVVVFPSFHAGMALIVAHALLGVRGLGIAAAIYAAAVVIATLPMGGHYLIDIVTTFALFAVLRVAPRAVGALRRRRQPAPKPIAVADGAC